MINRKINGFVLAGLMLGAMLGARATEVKQTAHPGVNVLKNHYKHDDFQSAFDVAYYPELYIPERYEGVVKHPDAIRQSPLYKKNRKYYDDLSRRYGKQLEQKYHANVSVRFVSKKEGYGLFADEKIKKGALIGEYTGKLLRKEEVDNGNDYLFTYPGHYRVGEEKRVRFYIDAQDQGNALRFANHSDKHSNAQATEIPYKGRWYIVYLAKKDIPKNHEIRVHYGTGYWKNRERPLEVAR